MPSMKVIWLFLVAAIASYGLTIAVRWVVLRQGVMDEPNLRSSHTRPTPRGGGLAIVIVFAMALSIGWVCLGVISSALAKAVLVGSLLVAAVGYVDDRSDLSATVRLSVHVVAVILAFSVTGGLSYSQGGPAPLAVQFMAGLACLWFLNLFNFMDGIDGIAATEAVFVSMAAAMLLSRLDAPPELLYSWLALSGASFGFLFHNWPPARIFMGDTGSGFLGFVIAILLVASTQVPGFSLWVAIILVSAFGADATVTLVRRMLRGDEWHRPHRSHAYQRLSRRWGRHLPVTLLYCAVNLVIILPCAAAAVAAPEYAPIVATVVFGALAWVAWRVGAGLPDQPTTSVSV
jgi:Fuc2NAc and GlcNAc transferase